MSTGYARVKDEAIGRWIGIFHELGIPIPESGKHGACPACGGKDRFRVDDKEGKGTWFCNGCGAGDGFGLVKAVFNIDFPQACEKVGGVMNLVECKPFRHDPEKDPRERLNALWAKSEPFALGDQVSRYLMQRGILYGKDDPIPLDIRFCPECWEPDTKKKYSAMLALVRDREGKPVTIHRTYLDGGKKAPIENPKKLMPGVTKLSAVAVRLFQATGVVGVAEGIETALSASMLFKIPVWATISTTIMESFLPPEGINQVIVCMDVDSNFAGEKAGYALAHKLAMKGYEVSVKIPKGFNDFNDELQHGKV